MNNKNKEFKISKIKDKNKVFFVMILLIMKIKIIKKFLNIINNKLKIKNHLFSFVKLTHYLKFRILVFMIKLFLTNQLLFNIYAIPIFYHFKN